jgi:hypothetical protein
VSLVSGTFHADGEPHIIDVGSYDDVTKALEDGRMERIAEEHKRYMKETNREI